MGVILIFAAVEVAALAEPRAADTTAPDEAIVFAAIAAIGVETA